MHPKSRRFSFSLPSSCMALLLFLSLGTTTHVRAAEYFVSPTGSDTHDGLSPATAWQTVAHVNTRSYSAGDRILFQGGGEFTGAGLVFGSGNSGTPENPIIVGSYGTGRATIRPTGNTAGISITNTGGITVRDLVFLGPGDRLINSRAGISARVTTGNAESPKFRGLRFENLSVGGFFDGVQVSSSTWNGFADVIFDGCFIHDNVANGMNIWGNYPGTSALQSHANIQILNTEVTGNLGDPALSNPAAQHSGSGIILSGVKGGLIDRCYAHHNGGGSNDNAGGGPVGIWTWNSDSVVIQRSLVHDQRTTPGAKDGGGFDIDGGATNAIIQYCYSYNNEGPGFLIAEFDNAPPLSHGTIRYNISWRDGRRTNMGMASGIHFWKGAGTAATLSNIWVYNNLVYTENATGGPAVTFQSGTMSNLNIWNNIFVVQGGERFVDIPNDAARNYFKFQGNLYWAIDGDYSGGWRWGSSGTTVFSSLADWRAAFGTPETLDGNPVGLQTDPRLFEIITGAQPTSIAEMEIMSVFSLLADSPALGAGLDLRTASFGSQEVGTRDFFGAAIPREGQFDIGPGSFEFNLMVLTPSLSSATQGASHQQSLTAAYGELPYAWTLESGDLPSGLALSGNGILQGIPSVAGSFPFTVRVTDSADPAVTATKTFTLSVLPMTALQIATTTMPFGGTGLAYEQNLAATGGMEPYTWSLTAGSLPPGLALTPATGVISGIPSTAGTYDFTITLTDSDTPATTRSQVLPILIGAPPLAPTALTALATSSQQITLYWIDNSTEETGYRLEVSPNGVSDWTLDQELAPDSSSASVSALPPGATRFFRVAASSVYGLSAWSNTASATTDSGDPNLIAWFTFDEGSGTSVADSTIIGNNHSTSGIANATWIASPGGKFGGAFGNTDMSTEPRPINVANQSDLDFDPRGDAYTLSAWVRVAAGAPVGYRTLFDKTTTSPSTNRQFRVWTGNSWSVLSVYSGNSVFNFTLPQALNDGQWHLITMTNFNDNGTWRFRVYFNDGTSFAQGNSGTGGKVDANFVIGSTSALSNGWRGNIDDVRIYNRALSQAEVGQLYAGTMPGSGSTSAPSAPTTLLASADPVSPQSQILLSWTDTATTESGFKIERSENGESGWTLIGTTAANLTAFTDPGLPAAATRHYRVLAYNSNGDSAPSAAASATTQSASSDDTFAAWADTISWNGADASPLANPDNDPYNNLAEYAMGLDPMAADGVVLQQHTEPDGNGGWHLVMSVPYNPAASDVVWELLRATTLPATPDAWTQDEGEVTVDYPTGRIQFSLPVPNPQTEAFLGLRLRLP